MKDAINKIYSNWRSLTPLGMNVCWLELKVALSMEQFVIRESATVRTFAKLYTPSTKNILMKLLSTAIWADK